MEQNLYIVGITCAVIVLIQVCLVLCFILATLLYSC